MVSTICEGLEAEKRQNRLIQSLVSGSPPQPGRSRAPASGPEDRYVFAREPYVSLVDGNAIVEGTVHNANDSSIEGFLVVSLIVNGQTKRSETLSMSLGANAVES